MIHATSLNQNHITYNNVYCFLKLYLDGPGTAVAETILYSDQTIRNQIGALPLGQYTFDQLGANPMDTLHTLTVAKFQQTNPNSTFTIVSPIIEPIQHPPSVDPPPIEPLIIPDPLQGIQ